jgi:hypothetical protein
LAIVVLQDPIQGGRQNLFARPLDDLQVRCATAHPIVVEVETGVESEPSIEDECADESRRRVARLLQCSGKRRVRTVEAERTVVAYAVCEGIAPGHDRRV